MSMAAQSVYYSIMQKRKGDLKMKHKNTIIKSCNDDGTAISGRFIVTERPTFHSILTSCNVDLICHCCSGVLSELIDDKVKPCTSDECHDDMGGCSK